MPYFNQSQQFFTDKAILAFTEGNIANISVTVPNTYIGWNREARRSVDEGLFVAEVGNTIRFLPRARNKTAIVTTAATFQMAPHNIFVPGDTLFVNEPYATLTITGAAAGQTQTITIQGRTATATATTTNTTTTAVEVVNAINTSTYVGELVYARNVANVVYIFAKNGVTNYPITEGGTITSTISGATLVVNTTPIGTIQNIDYLTGTVTLAALATVALPVDTSIGVPVNKILGLHVHSVDYTIATSKDLALYTVASGVRIQYLPYFDWQIAELFPKMLFDYKF